MRKFIITFTIMALFAGMVPMMMLVTVEAQTYVRKVKDRYGRTRYVGVRKPIYFRRHRNRINMAVGTGAGAIIGALVGGRKGALIGSGIGLGGSTLYTYKIRPKKRKYKKIRRY